MKKKHHEAAQRQVFKALQQWKDPHNVEPLTSIDVVKSMQVSIEGEVELVVKPSRPHCPCCLYDLSELRKKISTIKHISSVHIEVEGVPESGRWTRLINDQTSNNE
ncbi:MAG: iron-sulfur cluster assembly protein [archaeon]|nr:iron-sulfur cluster assembly protein [archaeon]MDA1168469.1 iron-sulfur cluster assembly protein [archaeon]